MKGTQITTQLADWQPDVADSRQATVTLNKEAILVELDDGRGVWVELQSGILRAHAFIKDSEAPVNLDITPEAIEVDTHGYDQERQNG